MRSSARTRSRPHLRCSTASRLCWLGHHRRCAADAARPGRVRGGARRRLPLHRQGKPAHPGGRHPGTVRPFVRRGPPDHVEVSAADHGRIETRRIWCSTRLNDYLTFPHAAQVFRIEREVFTKKTRKLTMETAVGVTSRSTERASPAAVLRTNRGHWCIENSCHYILDDTWDEDRCRIRTGHGPENTPRLRRFCISLLKHRARPCESIASMTRKLAPLHDPQFHRPCHQRLIRGEHIHRGFHPAGCTSCC